MDPESIPLLLSIGNSFANLFAGVTINPFSWQIGISIAVVILLLIISGYMSSSESAFFSLTPQDIHTIRNSNSKTDQTLLSLLGRSEELLATILICNNTVNIAIVLLSNYALTQLFDFGTSQTLSFVVQTIGLTLLLLLFGEIIPKVYATRNPLAFCRFSCVIMAPIVKYLSPLSKSLVKLGTRIERGNGSDSYDISVDDLSKAVELTVESGSEQSDIMEEIVRFYDKRVEDIMAPRIDMANIDYSWSFKAVLYFIVECGYSRIPVYEGTQDNIRGILYIKDCIPYINESDDFEWQNLIRPAFFVPENKKIDDLLEELRAKRIHIAIVVDEYGGTSGLVTMEDILEEIVGDITDEYDEEELPYTRLADGVYLFDAKTPTNDFCRLLDIDPSIFAGITQEVDTLSGLFLEIKQELPHRGDVVTYKDFTFEVTAVDKRRILQLKITLPASVGIADVK